MDADYQPEVVSFRRGQSLAGSDARHRRLIAITDGWAIRSTTLGERGRHVTGFFVPGDLCDPLWLGAPAQDSVVALTDVHGIAVDADRIGREMGERAGLRQKLLSEMALRGANAARWAASLVRLSALERICYLLCDVSHRHAEAGRKSSVRLPVPIAEPEIADATGLTLAHVRRVLADVRAADLATLSRKVLTIGDLRRLEQASGYVAEGPARATWWPGEFARSPLPV